MSRPTRAGTPSRATIAAGLGVLTGAVVVGFLTAAPVPAAPSAPITIPAPAAEVVVSPPSVPGPSTPAAAQTEVSPPVSAARPTLAGVIELPFSTPGDVTLTPDGRQMWIAHREAATISVVDVAARTVKTTIAVPAGPARFVAFCAGRAWVSVYSVLPNGQPDDSAPHLISVIDVDTLAEVATVPVGRRPFATACTPDGTRLIVPSHDDGRLDVIDTATTTLTRSVPVAANPHWVAIAANGTSVWTANHESNLATGLTSDLTERARVPVGASPHAVALSPDGRQVAVANFDGSSVSILDAATAQVSATIAVGDGPQDLVWTPDGAHILTVDVRSGQVSVIDVAARAVVDAIPVASPVGIAITPAGMAAVTSLDTSELTLLDTTTIR